MQKIRLSDSIVRKVAFYSLTDPAVPKTLFEAQPQAPDLTGVTVPLPSRRRDYTCFAQTRHALWMGAANGLTRYAPNAARKADRVMYFSANRELEDNRVLALYAPDQEKDVYLRIRRIARGKGRDAHRRNAAQYRPPRHGNAKGP